MSAQQPVELNHLTTLLNEKRSRYEKMLIDNKEFEEVKVLFSQIRELEKALKNVPSSYTSGDSALRDQALAFINNPKDC